MTNGELEAAVTAGLPGDSEAYFFNPILLWHKNGKCYGVFGGANQALAWQRGAGEEKAWFYLTNIEGERVTIKDQPSHPGHAYAILEALEKQEN